MSREEQTIRPTSPQPHCVICMDQFEEIAYVNSCWHMFCHDCLEQWATISDNCPICNNPIIRIYSLRDWEPEMENPPPYLLHVFRLVEATISDPDPSFGVLSKKRRHVYRKGEMVRGLRVPGDDAFLAYRTSIDPPSITPESELVRLLKPWLARELRVLLRTRDIFDIYDKVVDLLPSIETADFVEQLQPFFGDRTHHFAHEIRSFLRAPTAVIQFLNVYDAFAVYDSDDVHQ